MGRSEAGKTSLTQALKGEKLHYVKTQYTNTDDDTIDSPGEYAESKHFSVGLACFSFEADVVAMVQSADEPFSLFGYGSNAFILRPLIGIITKIDSPYANVPMVRQWMLLIAHAALAEILRAAEDIVRRTACVDVHLCHGCEVGRIHAGRTSLIMQLVALIVGADTVSHPVPCGEHLQRVLNGQAVGVCLLPLKNMMLSKSAGSTP